MKDKVINIVLALLFPLIASAAPTSLEATDAASAEDDTICISFLTCAPGEEIHRLYGHTALRIQTASDDWAVNFGWFSFNTPNFVMKFILGLTDYSMAYQSMPVFIHDMAQDNMTVTEQRLNLTPKEALDIQAAMQRILESEGYQSYDIPYGVNNNSGQPTMLHVLAAQWTYRYNFLYDNCTTRAVEAIKEVLKANGETLLYPSATANSQQTTQRKMIHEFTRQSPWYEFGQDLLLGPEVDETHTLKELTDGLNFLPTYAQHFFETAQIRDAEGNLRPLVAASQPLTPFIMPREQHPTVPIAPLAVAGIILASAILITMFQRKANLHAAQAGITTAQQRAWRIWGNAFDFTAWTLQGVVGLLLVIMVGWSQHPAVGTNWLLLLFNPIFILGIPARLWMPKVERCFGWTAIVLALATIIVGACHVQELPIAIYPIALAVAIRGKEATLK